YGQGTVIDEAVHEGGKRRRVENAKRKADDAEAEVNEVVEAWTENDVFDGDSRLSRHEQRRQSGVNNERPLQRTTAVLVRR
ncbi:hypothetical protein L915_07464, partial [Phytophthora nicotianae]